MRSVSRVARVLVAATCLLGCSNGDDERSGYAERVGEVTLNAVAPPPQSVGFFTDPEAVEDRSPLPNGGEKIVLRKELSGYPAYGVDDTASDILYTGQAATWQFTLPADVSADSVDARYRVSLTIDDHDAVNLNDYVIDAWANGVLAARQAVPPHGVPFGGPFSNWVTQEYDVSLGSTPFAFSLHNGSATSSGDWLAVDWLELELVPAVSVATLAKLSRAAYTPGIGGVDGFLPRNNRTAGGFSATAYQRDADVVVAFRGTEIANADLIKNLLADASFVTGQPTPQLDEGTSRAVDFLQEVHTAFPDKRLTLTGHSLGGAYAQLLGAVAKLRTISFNAPGPRRLAPQLQTALQRLSPLGASSQIVNYRFYGDAISLVPDQTDQTDQTGQLGETKSVVPKDFAWRLLIDTHPELFIDYHRIDLLVTEIPGSTCTIEAGRVGGTPLIVGVNLVVPGFNALLNAHLKVLVAANLPFVVDPLPGNGYTIVGTSGPLLQSIGLPELPGVTHWRATTFDGVWWSRGAKVVAGGAWFTTQGVRGFRFVPLGPDGNDVYNSSHFAFGLTFVTGGTFEGDLTVNGAPDCGSAVASPAELWPPNGAMMQVRIANVTDVNGDPLTLRVTEVTQDEPLTPRRNPDANLSGEALSLRATRQGSGNGRVYQVAFVASDGQGGECRGSVRVAVPHDRSPGGGAMDDGQAFNSGVSATRGECGRH